MQQVSGEFWEFLRRVIDIAVRSHGFCEGMGFPITYKAVNRIEPLTVEKWATNERYLAHWVLWEKVYEGWQWYRSGDRPGSYFTAEVCLKYLATEFDSKTTTDSNLKTATIENADSLASAMRDQFKSVRRTKSDRQSLPDKQADHSEWFDQANLTANQRECLSLKWEYGMPILRIAIKLGKDRSSVQTCIARGEARLKKVPKFRVWLKQEDKPQH